MGKENLPCDHMYDVVGSLCENNDKFAIDRMLPKVDTVSYTHLDVYKRQATTSWTKGTCK